MTNLPTRIAIASALLAPALAVQAAEYANVVSAAPVTTQVAVPQRVCRDERQWIQPQPSGAGALIGAITGGVIGNNIGGGFGRAAATGLGVVLGSAIGNQVEADGYPAREVAVQRCRTVSAYENRTLGYDVVYEYAGRRYSTRLPYDPGNRLAIDVRPAGGSQPVPPAAVDDGYRAPPAVYAPQPSRIGTPVPAAVVYANPNNDDGWRDR